MRAGVDRPVGRAARRARRSVGAAAERGQDAGGVVGEAAGAVQPGAASACAGLGVGDEGVHARPGADRAEQLVEEDGLAADDADVGLLQAGGQHRGLRLGDLPLRVEPGQPDVLLGGQPQPVLLVLARGVVQRGHRGGLLGEAGGLRPELLADHRGLGGGLRRVPAASASASAWRPRPPR